MTQIDDVVVVLPGIMGSTLHRGTVPVWELSAGAAARGLWSLGDSITELALPAGVGDESPEDDVRAVALMSDIHVIPGLWTAQVGYSKLTDWLRARFQLIPETADGPPANLIEFPYDWRLSNRYNGGLLASVVEPALERWQAQGGRFADARLVFICHSMGGLVARWYLQREGGAAQTAKLITIGTPHRGSLDALDKLVNGVSKRIGPWRIDLTSFAQTLPSIHQLLPEYACIERKAADRDEIELLKTTELSIPGLSTAMSADAMLFHDELDAGADGWWLSSGFDVHVIHGQSQTTKTTGRLDGDVLVALSSIGDRDERGDGTVPSLSAQPKGVRPNSPLVHHVTGRHGSLQHHAGVFDEIEGILTASEVVHRSPLGIPIDVQVEDVLVEREELVVRAGFPQGGDAALVAVVTDEKGARLGPFRLAPADGAYRAEFGALPPGAYEVHVGGFGSAVAAVTPVSTPVVVWRDGGG